MDSTDPTAPQRSFWWSLRGLFAALGAVATTAVAVVGLFLPPDNSHDKPVVIESRPLATPVAPPPAAAPTAMLGDIISVKDASTDPCCTFAVRFELSGFNGQECTLTATLVDTYDGTQTEADEYHTVTPEADTDRASIDVAVPITETGTYSVRFDLTDPDGVELDSFETEPFDVD